MHPSFYQEGVPDQLQDAYAGMKLYRLQQFYYINYFQLIIIYSWNLALSWRLRRQPLENCCLYSTYLVVAYV